MNLTIQIITKNNEKTIKKCIESIPNCNIMIFDIGSTDNTCSICNQFNIKPHKIQFEEDYSKLREKITEKSNTTWQMMIQPWETLIQGSQLLNDIKNECYISILQGNILSKEIRIWGKNTNIINPVFEYIKSDTELELPIILSSKGDTNNLDKLNLLNKWKTEKPLLADPYYYEACVFLAMGKYNEFLLSSEKFMFMERLSYKSTILNKYYYSMIQMLFKKNAKIAMQNITQCLANNPLMAEFWCLAGDIYYQLLNDFRKAKSLYENAIIMGNQRRKDSKWPMDINKYKKYPEKMIKNILEYHI